MADLRSLLTASRIVEAYGRAEEEILREMAEGLKADPNLSQIRRLRRQAERIASDLGEITPQLVEAELRLLIEQGSTDAFSQVLRPRFEVPTAPSILMVVGELSTALSGVAQGILRAPEDVYRIVTQQNVANALIRGEARQKTVQKALRDYAARGVTGFVDRAGREWNMTSYVDMSVRTAKLRAYREQHSATLQAMDLNLIQIHGGNDICDMCGPWTRKVISLDPTLGAGNHRVESYDGSMVTVHIDGTIDDAIADGLEHPNCRCTRVAFIPGMTELPPEPNIDREREKAQDTLRGFERQVRSLKRQQMFSDDPSRERAKINQVQARIRELVKVTGIERNRAREQIRLK